jgi:glutamate-1-semialdehyde 2,1-aminomutase
MPNSIGILPALTDAVSVATANDCDALQQLFDREGSQLAAFILEPILYSPGCILIDDEYLQLARTLCTEHGTILILDEVMTGFRNGVGGAGARLGIQGDLGAFGKAMANGYIIAALVGRRDLMNRLAPAGPVFYSGTFNGHPLSVAATQASLDIFEHDGVPARLEELTARICDGINAIIEEAGVMAICQGRGGVWTLYFNTRSVRDYRDLARSTTPTIEALNQEFRHFLMGRGIYMHKRHMNRCFVSFEHTDEDADRILDVVGEFIRSHREAIG